MGAMYSEVACVDGSLNTFFSCSPRIVLFRDKLTGQSLKYLSAIVDRLLGLSSIDESLNVG